MLHRTETENKVMERAYAVLNDTNAINLQGIITRAPRRELDAGGRQRKIGKNVAAIVRQLWFWEGRGEAEDGYIWKTAEDWELAEDGLSYSMLRTARDVAAGEGLLKYEQRECPDGRTRVFYRLDLVGVLRVVALSEGWGAEKWLDKHSEKHSRRKHWEDKLAWAETMLKDLSEWGVEERVTEQQTPLTSSNPSRYKLLGQQESTAEENDHNFHKKSISKEIPKKKVSLAHSEDLNNDIDLLGRPDRLVHDPPTEEQRHRAAMLEELIAQNAQRIEERMETDDE